jgi:hypothetical protein
MKKTTKSGIMSLLNTTSLTPDPPVVLTKEAEEEYRSLKLRHARAASALQHLKIRPTRAHREEEEVARANLRSFERRYGLTPRLKPVSSGS